MNTVKSSGPRVLPCGTPDVTRRIQDKEFKEDLLCPAIQIA